MIRCCVTETSTVDGRSCVLTLARCLDNAVCYASLRRLKTDCVWNDIEDRRTGSGKTTGKTIDLERGIKFEQRKRVNYTGVDLTVGSFNCA